MTNESSAESPITSPGTTNEGRSPGFMEIESNKLAGGPRRTDGVSVEKIREITVARSGYMSHVMSHVLCSKHILALGFMKPGPGPADTQRVDSGLCGHQYGSYVCVLHTLSSHKMPLWWSQWSLRSDVHSI